MNTRFGLFLACIISFSAILLGQPFIGLAAKSDEGFAYIKPILENKCAVCHAENAERPFSAHIPIWNYATGTHTGLAQKKYAIDALLNEGETASEGHLKMLEHVVEKGSMPPAPYRLLRPSKRLTEDERRQILDWIYHVKPEWSKK